MKTIGPLMVEHRLIERMIALMQSELQRMKQSREIDAVFLATAIDFMQVYADRTHHGKEEDIFFRELVKKKLKPQDLKTMNELVEEHAWARSTVKDLVSAREGYLQGNTEKLDDIILLLRQLAEFYPRHIEKEDKRFFFNVLEYFSNKENDAVLDEFWDFDRKLIHEKYAAIVDDLQASREPTAEADSYDLNTT